MQPPTKLFGTDGIRGVANRAPLTPDVVLRLGQLLVQRGSDAAGVPRIVIGRDTRRSGDFLESALVAGICSAGGEALLAGVIPTPAVALLVRRLGADAGVVISASHNPFPDNGIKIFGRDGFKLADATESEIEQQLVAPATPDALPSGADVGIALKIDDAAQRYIEALHAAAGASLKLAGQRIVIDCANGAASFVAAALLERCGATVEVLCGAPNGTNINEACGAVHPQRLQEAVLQSAARFGIALDGDADRLILVDEAGSFVDGDEILAILALDMLDSGALPKPAVVATVMSNLGLELALRQRGVQLLRAAVGDRYVVERMRQEGLTLGGEQSGHIVMLEHATTGDGLLAALCVAAVMQRRHQPLSELRQVMRRLPQTLRNVRVRSRVELQDVPAVRDAVAAAQNALGDRGRVLIRYSGTEPLVRVMVEGVDAEHVEQHAARIAAVVREALGE